MKKTILSIIIIILFSSCSQTSELKPVKKEPSFWTLKAEPFTEMLEFTGDLQANRETKVAAKVGGRLASINVEIGDFVLEGILLGKLAGDESTVSVQTSKTQEQNIQQSFVSQKNFLNEQVENAKKALEIAQMNLKALDTSGSDTQITTSEQKELATKALEQSKVMLDNIEKAFKQSTKSIYKTAKSNIRAALIAITNANTFSDNILGLSPTSEHLNNNFDDNLGSLDSSTKSTAENSLSLSLEKRDALKHIYDEKIDNKEPAETEYDAFLETALEALEHTQTMLKDLFSMLEKTTSGSSLAESTIQNWKSETLNHGTITENAILNSSNGEKGGIKGLIMSIEEMKTKYDIDVASAKSIILQKEQALNNVSASSSQSLSSIESQKDIVEKQVEQAEIALKQAKAQKDSALKNLQTQIDLVKGNLRLSQVAVKNTHIGAPFNGIITEKFGEVGQIIASGQPVFSVADVSLFKVRTYVSDLDLSNIFIGMEARMQIDGLQGDFTGSVSKIYPKLDSNVRKGEIEITLNQKPEKAVIGMFVRINLLIPEKNAYFIPKKFLKIKTNQSFVLLKDGTEKNVSVGIEKDDQIKIWFPGEMENIIIREF